MEVPSHRDRAPSVEDVRRVLDRKRKPADDNGQRAINPGLVVNACGHTVFVPDGNSPSLLLKHVQKTLQDGLDMQSGVFEIYDRTGIRLRTDQDARDAVRAGRTPFHGTCESRRTSEMEWMCQSIGSLKSEMENQKQEYQMEFECLRNVLSSAVEAFKSELHASAELLQATRAEIANTGCSSPGTQKRLLTLNLEQGMPLVSAQQLSQIQNEFWSVSKNMQDDLQAISSKVQGVSAFVNNSLEEYSLCASHLGTIQTKEAVTKLAGQCETFNVRLSNVEHSIRENTAYEDAFLDQLKRDADIIPESIRELSETPPASPDQGQRMVSQPSLLGPHLLGIAESMYSTRSALRAPKIADSADRASQSTPPSLIRSQPDPAEDAVMCPLTINTRSSVRSSSPGRHRMDCTRSLTISESPTRRRSSGSKSRMPISPTEERRRSREQRELATRELASLPQSTSLHSSVQPLPSKSQAIRMQPDRSEDVQSAFATFSACAVQPVSAPTDDGMTRKITEACQPAAPEEIVFRGRIRKSSEGMQRDHSEDVQSAFVTYSGCAVQPVSAPKDDGMKKKITEACQPAAAEEIVFRGRLLEAAASHQPVAAAEPTAGTSVLGPPPPSLAPPSLAPPLQPARTVTEAPSNGCSQIRIARGAARTPSPMPSAGRLQMGCGPLNPQVRQVASRSNVTSCRKSAMMPSVLPSRSQTDSYLPEPGTSLTPPRASSLGHRSVGHPVILRS